MSRSKVGVVLVAIAWIVATGLIDAVTGYDLRLYPLYFLPIAYGAWTADRRVAAGLATLSTVIWLGSNLLAGAELPVLIWAVNSFAQLLSFGLVGLLIAELRRHLLAERSLSRSDALTGLLNARAFHERGEQLLVLARRGATPIALAYLDLDGFKAVNDRHGHQAGDEALIGTARALTRSCRDSDVVARLGGDEFAVLLYDTDAVGAQTLLDRVRSALADELHGRAWSVTVSIGAMVFAPAPTSMAAAIEAADALMYRAKSGGKDRVLVEAAGG